MANKWEYVIVELANSYGNQYRLNGDKVHQWKDKPMHDVLSDLGSAGWELTTYDGTQYIFKRPLHAGDGHDLHEHHQPEQQAQSANPA